VYLKRKKKKKKKKKKREGEVRMQIQMQRENVGTRTPRRGRVPPSRRPNFGRFDREKRIPDQSREIVGERRMTDIF